MDIINVGIRTENGDIIPAIPVGVRLNPFRWLQGKWRMLFKFCPECNSSAPECDGCQVCHNNRELFYYWKTSKNIRKMWWSRYVLKHTTHPDLKTDISTEEWRQITGYEQM